MAQNVTFSFRIVILTSERECMPKVFLEDLKPEMVLERPITDQFGLILFQKGVILTEKSISTLKMWGINEVSIDSGSITESMIETPSDPVLKEEIRMETDSLFRFNPLRGLFLTELFRHTEHRKMKLRTKEHTNAE